MQELDTTTQLTPKQAGLVQSLLEACVREVQERVSRGEDGKRVVGEIMKSIEHSGSIGFSDRLYSSWYQKLLVIASTHTKNAFPSSPGSASSSQQIKDIVLGNNKDTKKDIRITPDERKRSISIVGASGTGKTTLISGVSLQAIENGECVILFAVEPDIINNLLMRIPEKRMADVVFLDFSDRRRFLGLNYLEQEEDIEHCIELLKRLWNITPETPNLENTLRASFLTLQYNNLMLDRMIDLLRDKDFRASCMARIPHTLDGFFVRSFWEKDFNLHDVQYQIRGSDSTLNKIMQMFMDKYIGYIVGQERTTLHIRKDIVDKKKILLVHLSKFELEKERVRRIGAMVLGEVKRALFSRDDLPEKQRHIVNLICDEWQLYATPDFFEDVLTQGRRYGVSTVLATQTLANFDKKLHAILDQVGTHITFGVGREDAHNLAPFYALDPQPEYKEQEIKTPVPRPINYYVVGAGRSHKSSDVNTFMKLWEKTVRIANVTVSEGQIDVETTSVGRRGGVRRSEYHKEWSNSKLVELAQIGLKLMNELLYQAMLEKKPFQVVSVFLLVWMVNQFNLPFFDLEAGMGYFSALLSGMGYFSALVYGEYDEWQIVSQELIDAYTQLWLVPDNEFEQACTAFHALVCNEFRARYREKAQEYCKLLYQRIEFNDYSKTIFRENRQAKMNGTLPPPRTTPYFPPETTPEHEYEVLCNRLREFESPHFLIGRIYNDLPGEKRYALPRVPVPYEQLAYEPVLVSEAEPNRELSHIFTSAQMDEYGWIEEDNTLIVPWYHWRLKPGTLEPHIDTMIAPFVQAELAEKDSFFAFVKLIRAVFQALVNDPPLERSGVFEKVEAGQRSFADMEKEKEKELLRDMPDGIAFVSMRMRGERYTPRLETIPLDTKYPRKRPYDKGRQWAFENTIEYTTERTVIDEEFLKRRQRLGIGVPAAEQHIAQEIEENNASPVPSTVAKRRTGDFSLSLVSQLPLPSNTSDDDLLMCLYLFSFLTIDQVCRFLQKETSINNIREKINKLVASSLVEPQPLPRTVKGGRSKLVYSLTTKGMKKLGEMRGFTLDASRKRGGFTEHTLLISDFLIAAALLGKVEPCIHFTHLENERVLKQHPIDIGNGNTIAPDGFVSFSLTQPYGVTGEIVGLVCELDTGSETFNQWKEKLGRYETFVSGSYQERYGTNSLTIAVVVPSGDQARISELVDWTKKIFAHKKHIAELFLFAACDPATLDPLTLFTSPLFTQPFASDKHALIEKLV